MKLFWDDGKKGVDAKRARATTKARATKKWADLRRSKGNFFGLIDAQDRTLQFMYEDDVPKGVDDAGHLRIVRAEIPLVERKGSVGTLVTIAQAAELVERVFTTGADPAAFPEFVFEPW